MGHYRLEGSLEGRKTPKQGLGGADRGKMSTGSSAQPQALWFRGSRSVATFLGLGAAPWMLSRASPSPGTKPLFCLWSLGCQGAPGARGWREG